MKLDDLGPQHLRYIHSLYQTHCGMFGVMFEAKMLKCPKEALMDLLNLGSGNYRIGSRYSEDSRLIIKTDQSGKVRVEFDPRCQKDEAIDSKNFFEDSVRMYLVDVDKESKR